MQNLLEKHRASGRLRVTSDVAQAIRDGTVLFICVGTPQKESGEADLAQIEALAQTIAENLNGYKLIVEKSTVPVITGQWIRKTINRYLRMRAGILCNEAQVDTAVQSTEEAAFDIASNPEFLQEGRALHNILHPDRVICGVESARAREILAEIDHPLNCPVLFTNLSTAEVTKHAANAFLSTKISFINMVADLCQVVGADVTQVAQGLGLDPRIGPDFLRAGIGFGGYCFPKDLRAFIHLAEQKGVDFSLLIEVERINQRRIEIFMNKVREALWVLRGKRLGILGLSFKPDTDDIREAPSLKLIPRLVTEGAILKLFDPQAMPAVRALLPPVPDQLTYADSAYEAAEQADALFVLTEWPEFAALDLRRVRNLMRVPLGKL